MANLASGGSEKRGYQLDGFRGAAEMVWMLPD